VGYSTPPRRHSRSIRAMFQGTSRTTCEPLIGGRSIARKSGCVHGDACRSTRCIAGFAVAVT
jgi:hypothetical protein